MTGLSRFGLKPRIKLFLVGEDANVKIGLKQRIPGIEMAITNCTVFDSSYTQSYSVIDYPRCPDDLVKANIPSGSNQERFSIRGLAVKDMSRERDRSRERSGGRSPTVELGDPDYKIRSPNNKILSIVQIPHDLGIAFNFDVLHKDSTRDEF